MAARGRASTRGERTLALRELNRALLARQLLLERHALPLTCAIERVAGLQAQWWPSPYIGLWTRLEGFERDSLTRALTRRQVVKATLMRQTLHLVSRRDYLAFAAALEEAELGFLRRRADLRALAAASSVAEKAIELAALAPRTRPEIFELLEREVGEEAQQDRAWIVWSALRVLCGFVQVPPAGTWGYWGAALYAPAREWIAGTRPDGDEGRRHLVERYLAAFGPASTADLSQWTGLSVAYLREAVRQLEPKLRRFGDEAGRTLLDLRRAPIPDPDITAPVRYLPKWDSTLLAHAVRDRILPPEYRKTVIRPNGDVLATFLVDGYVAGTWEIIRKGKNATLKLTPFGSMPRPVRTDLREEGARLLAFVEPESGAGAVRM